MKILSTLLLLLPLAVVQAQHIGSSPEYIRALTSEWQGERFADGRPKVSDNLLERLKKLTLEEVWAELIELGYHNQYEGQWTLLDESEESTMTGRAVTAQFMPLRPDLEQQVIEQGKAEGRIWQQRRTVSWAISTLVEGDVYVADAYLKPHLGTVIGSNLGNGVFARSRRGGIFYGNIRDPQGLRNIDGFQAWVKGIDPSYMRQTLLTSINAPVRIGSAIVLPGDAVLAKRDGVVFIPPHLLEHIVLTGEVTALFDVFGQQRIKEGKYSAGEIDSAWTDAIKQDFRAWAKENNDKLPMSLQSLNKYLEKRNF
ncbi:MAG: hypothetical protein LBC40_01170 [Dysgonamonadaceae bacterium]|jgi:regulator of RNase E activity RraA|nr:hypothetical protein [Dysgonamonadaceae bacterium]